MRKYTVKISQPDYVLIREGRRRFITIPEIPSIGAGDILHFINTDGNELSDVGNRYIVTDVMERGSAGAYFLSIVRLGEWIFDPNGCDWGLGAWCCSNCHQPNGQMPTMLNGEKIKNPYAFQGSQYCPNCGVMMREKG